MTEAEKQEAIRVLTKKIAGLENGSIDMDAAAWLTFTGLPEVTLPILFEWAFVKKVTPEELLMVVAAIAFQHGRERATESEKAASDSI